MPADADGDAQICNLALLKIGSNKDLISSLDDPGEVADILSLIYPQSRDDLLRTYRWPWAQRRAYLAQLGGNLYDSGHTYGLGDYVSQVPSALTTQNLPENVDTFVYLSLAAGNIGNSPSASPTKWRQISRAAWSYVFTLPDDLIKVHGLYHANLRNPREDQKIPFAIEYEPTPAPGALLFTDAGLPWEALWGQVLTQPATIELQYTARVTDTTMFPSDFSTALAWDIAEDLCLSLLKDPAKAAAIHKASLEALAIATAAARQEAQPDIAPIPSHIAARR